MRELEERLVAYYYGETANRQEIERLLAEDASLRKDFEELSALLDSVHPTPPPEVEPSYGDRVWERIEWRLETGRPKPERRQTPRSALSRPWLALAACLLIGVFAIGYLQWETPETAAGLSGDAQQRLLLLAVAEHFDRSHHLLAELMNAPEGSVIDLSDEKETAAELLAENRLYQQTARHAQRQALLFLLEEIERVLVEVRNGPAQLHRSDFRRLKDSIENPGLLFKIQIFQADDRDNGFVFEESL